MPNASSFLLAAVAGYTILLVLIFLGAYRLYRLAFASIISRTLKVFLCAVFLISQVPFVYYLFFYKSLRLAIPTLVWFMLWFVGFAIVGALLSVLVWDVLRRLWQFLYSQRQVEKQSEARDVASQTVVPRREFLMSISAAGFGAFLSSRSFIAHDHELPRIEYVDFYVPRLPHGFEGMRVAVYSDIHASPFMLRGDISNHRRLIEIEKPELILLPGDFINNRSDEVIECCEALADFHAPLGVYAVTGNHDYFSNDIEGVTAQLEQCGIRFLRNTNIRLSRNGDTIQLLGIDDPFASSVGKYIVDGFTYEKELENMLRGHDQHLCSLLLCHRPYRFPEFARIGMDAMIAGHTHGGQIVLGEVAGRHLSFSGMSSPFIAGKYIAEDKRSVLYVSRGVGSVGIPLRLNAPPEITILTLRSTPIAS